MMEPPRKRPRLSIFNTHTPDAELEDARSLNDLNLKSRFEAIFEKYSHDFTGIGDEIDVETGEVVVNNGHLESMEGETDTGDNSTPAQGVQFGIGKSLLRAMTVVPEEDNTFDKNAVSDEIITSIETMAENAGLAEDDSESEDDLFDTGNSREQSALDGRPDEDSVMEEDRQLRVNYSSDEDSLLKGGGDEEEPELSERSGSPDSLFEVAQPSSDTSQLQREETSGSSALPRPEIDPDMSNEAILDRFGPDVGGQVLGLLEHRSRPNDSHVEEAWRIPIDIGPLPSSKTATPVVDPLATSSLSRERELSTDHQVSLWGKQPRNQVRKRKKKRKSVIQRVTTPEGYREGSEDPLQLDFCVGTKSRPVKKLSESLNGDSEEEDQINDTRQSAQGDSDDQKRDASQEDSEGEPAQVSQRDSGSEYEEARPKKRRVPRSRRPRRTKLVPIEEIANTNEVDQGSVPPVLDATSDEDSPERSLDPEDRGICSYCKQKFANKSSVMAHWDRLLRKYGSQVPEGDPHDMKLIGFTRGGKPVRVRCERATYKDFRTLVELHEGAGISFAEIVAMGVLRTQKTAPKLQDLYEKHRTIPGTSDYHIEFTPWTAEEEQILRELCKNESVTIATLKRSLKDRDEIDIGNKLAEGFLKLLCPGAQPRSTFRGEVSNEDILRQWGIMYDATTSREVEIKEEQD